MVIRTVAVIVGAGIGRRVGTRRPKQFEDVAGRPLIAHTLEVFDQMPEIDGVVIVVPADWVDFTRAMLARNRFSKVLDVVPGGASRQMSSFSGLILAGRLGGKNLKKVVIHDAVRPLVKPELILQVIKAADDGGAATAVCRLTDTMLRSDGDSVIEVVDRSDLVSVQTPQAFDPKVIMEAHRAALTAGLTEATDDVQLVLNMGRKARIVESDPGNLKVTYSSDIKLLEKILENCECKEP